MDYVYICRPGENEELRYSIRSVFKYATDPRVVLFGNKPSWYAGEFVPIREGRSKFDNIHNAVNEIANSDLVSDNFVLMNDDFYLLKPFDGLTVYHGGSLEEKIERYSSVAKSLSYIKSLQKTLSKLKLIGIDSPLDYDIHVPFPMNKQKLQETIKMKTLYRSTYGNLANVGGKQISDVKVYGNHPMQQLSFDYTNNDAEFISSLDVSFQQILNDILINLFDQASPVEAAANVSGKAS